MKTVLITGASGFLGQAIVKELSASEDWEIYAVTSGRRAVSFPKGVHTVAADLTSESSRKELFQMISPHSMIHLAWNLSKRGFLNSDTNLTWMTASLDLLNLFARGGKRFLFAGSSSEYGYNRPICRESDATEPSDLYGLCKLSFERIAAQFCASCGVECSTLRIFPVYGPGEGSTVHAIPAAIDALLRGEQFVCKGPNNIWDYVYVDDVAKAAVSVLESSFCGTVNIASGKGTPMRDAFCAVAAQLGREDLLLFENEHIPGKTLIGDTRVLREKLGFDEFTPFARGMKATVSWWKDQRM